MKSYNYCNVILFVLSCIYQPSHSNMPHTRIWKTDKLEDQHFWRKVGQSELEKVLQMKNNLGVAKNVILFLGDGMSLPTITASRIFQGQSRHNTAGEEEVLTFETFPHIGLAKTYNVDKQVPDSAATAVAYLCGVKTNYKTIGTDSTVVYKDCASVTEENKISSIINWAQDAGKKTGFVTTTRVTHATPAATYSHVADRDWECDMTIPKEEVKKCPRLKDIATQLVEDSPGKDINIILGGGYSCMTKNFTYDPWEEKLEDRDCDRQDNRELHKQWLHQKLQEGKVARLVRNLKELNTVDLDDTEYLMGLFSNSHLPYEYEIREHGYDVPTLSEMATTAIKMLQSHKEGYFLLVEGGRIDHAHHDTMANIALDETVVFSEALENVLQMIDLEDTLVVVTADHSHTMSMNGYPKRGQDITGLAAMGDDNLPYTTLMYANGPGFNYTVVNGEASRLNLTETNVEDWRYVQLSAVPRDSETHGGDDVPIYAIGPMSHLFSGVHEQNYIAHAMAYASCIGTNLAHCSSSAESSTSNKFSVYASTTFTILMLLQNRILI